MTASPQREPSGDEMARHPCFHCGAMCGAQDAACWFCKHEPFARPMPPRTYQFSIATVLFLTLLIALCLAAFRFSPLVGVGLGLWLVPAAVRTLIAIEQHKSRVPRLVLREKVWLGVSSLLVSGIGCAAGGIAFLPVFLFAYVVTSGGLLEPAPPARHRLGMLVGIILGSLAGMAASGLILWLGRPSKLHRDL